MTFFLYDRQNLSKVCRLHDHIIKYQVPVLIIKLVYERGIFLFSERCTVGLHRDEELPWRRKWQPTPVSLPGESPWVKGPGGLQSMQSQRVRHDWATKNKHMEFPCFTFKPLRVLEGREMECQHLSSLGEWYMGFLDTIFISYLWVKIKRIL